MRSLLLLLIALLPLTAVPGLAQTPIRGFPTDQWKSQHEQEQRANAIPSPTRIRVYMEQMSARPHAAGSPGSKAVAEYTLAQFREWGLAAHIEHFEALLPYPTVRVLEMTAPWRFRAKLKEPAIPEDKDSGEPDQLPTFNAYSASGDVTAPLVYVNFGVPDDYDFLKQQGIDVRGKIVIARYGRSWRGVKAKLAQENGAVGCLIYSDPHEDGFFQGDVYPKGPMRPPEGVQRGSVIDMAIYPGDPLSPGWASVPGSRRLSRADAKVLLKIPVMPISYADAKPLLEALGGPVAPDTWRGALPLTYHFGPGPAVVHLKLDFDWTNKPLRDVIATIPGSVYKDQWIVYGNHHDAWVNGALDPGSGASALLETARTLAQLRKQGWQPKRTIVFALWDGEEFGLTGSTEWVEKHENAIERNAAVYINSDWSGRGAISASGSHTLETFVREVLRDVNDPVSGRTLLDTSRERRRAAGNGNGFRLGALGAGSDYVAFLDHAGIASINLGFNGGGNWAGIYHSIYDTFTWFQKFSDGDFQYEKTLSQVMTTSLLRLADAPVLPFEFGTLARTVRRYTGQIQREAHEESGAVDFQEVEDELARLGAASRNYDQELSSAMRQGAIPSERLLKVNETVQKAEHTLLLPGGLPKRQWYRNQIYAPGLYTGYGAKTLPGVREAVENQQWNRANYQARRLAQVLHAMTLQVEEAARDLSGLNAK